MEKRTEIRLDSELYEGARHLANLFLASDEYKMYLECRAKVEEQEGLEASVNAFRKEAFLLQCQGEDVYQREVGGLREKFGHILELKIVRDYLDAEINLCRTMQEVQSILVENVDIKTDFLD